MSLQRAREHLLHTRFRAAVECSRELLAGDSAVEAAGLLLRIRIEQGWFGDAIQLARERFRLTLPSTREDSAAAARMHLARAFAGAPAEEAVRELCSIAEGAHGRADSWLEALASECMAKVALLELQMTESGSSVEAFRIFRRAAELYATSGDRQAFVETLLPLAHTMLVTSRPDALRMLGEAEVMAMAEGLAPLIARVRLRMLAVRPEASDTEVDALLATVGDREEPVLHARMLRQRVTRGLLRGDHDDTSIGAALAVFRAQEALLDQFGFLSDLAERRFALGRFAEAAASAQEGLATCRAMPFAVGEATVRTMLATSLLHLGRFTESAAEYEKIAALPQRHRRKRRLDVLPRVGFLLQVRQPAFARQLALEYVRDIGNERPSRELSIALHYLANASVDLRDWEEVYDALERSASVDLALGDIPSAAMKRMELADWRVKSHWLEHKAPPAEVLAEALRVFDEEEARLEGVTSLEADQVRMRLHQSRATTMQAAGWTDAALEELERFARLAEQLGSRVHQSNYHTQAGLILHDRGVRGDHGAASRAQPHFDAALKMTRVTAASDAVANAAYLAAANERVLGHYATSDEDARAHRMRALALLNEADARVAELQMRYAEPGASSSVTARTAIHGPWKKVYDIAVELSLFDLGDFTGTFAWVERWKGRALAVSLGTQPLRHPEHLPERLIGEELQAMEALGRADSYAALLVARDRLQEAWNALDALPEASEYVALRMGRPVGFSNVVTLISAEEEYLGLCDTTRIEGG